MDFKTILILGAVSLFIILISVHFIKKSAWYKRVKATGTDVWATIDGTLGWLTSPYLWLGAIWVLYNPTEYSYYEYMKDYDFTSGEHNVLVVFIGVFLTLISLFFILKAWKKLAFLGHLIYFAIIGVYIYALYEYHKKNVDANIEYTFHILMFLTIYGALGMIFPKISKKTHSEVGANIDTDDVKEIAGD